MKLTTGRYTVILSVQTILLVIDWVINICSLLTRDNNALMLVLFILQDACIILSLSALLLTFFSTYVFQTGLVYLLYERFRATLIMCMVYFGLTTVIHIWSLWLLAITIPIKEQLLGLAIQGFMKILKWKQTKTIKLMDKYR
ncbi:hypothetical protein NQ315_010554, partial [Exocentrus adspersus]